MPALLVKAKKNKLMHAIIIIQFFLENICEILNGHTTETVLSAVVRILNHTLMKLANCGIIMYIGIQKL